MQWYGWTYMQLSIHKLESQRQGKAGTVHRCKQMHTFGRIWVQGDTCEDQECKGHGLSAITADMQIISLSPEGVLHVLIMHASRSCICQWDDVQ